MKTGLVEALKTGVKSVRGRSDSEFGTQKMQEVLQSTTGQLVIGIAGLLILTTIGAFLVLRFRDGSDSSESNSDLLSKFREMRQEGHINEDEYRTIRTDLEAKLSQQASAGADRPNDADLQGS